MPLPEVTHLQFLILDALEGGGKPGRLLRETLDDHGAGRSLAAFYQLMMRMEEAGLVEGWYEQAVVDGQLLKTRHYRILDGGISARSRAVDFYAARR